MSGSVAVSINTCPVSAWAHKSHIADTKTLRCQCSVFTGQRQVWQDLGSQYLSLRFQPWFVSQVSVSLTQSPALIWVAASSVARAQPPVSRCEAESGLQSLIKRWRRGRGLKVKQWALFNCSDSFLQGYDGNPSNFGLCSAFNCNYLYTLFNLIDESPIFGSNRSSRSANLCPISPPSSQTFTISLPSDGTSFFQSHIHLWVI